ncbi:MAG: response regulator [Pseudomonadota bacterium]
MSDTQALLRPRPPSAPHLYLVAPGGAAHEGLYAYFLQQGMRVTAIGSAEEMLRRMHRLRPDLVVLSAELPGMSGLEACRRLRADGDRLGLVLLDAADDEIDRVLALEMGADDVLSRPFGARELLARVRAVLRRTPAVPGVPPRAGGVVRIGAQRFDLSSRSLHGAGRQRALASVEYSLLAELVRSPRVPLSRERLLAVSHGAALHGVSARAVDAAVVRLRRLVEPDPAQPRYIQTVRGHGYMFLPDAPA